MTLEIMRCVAGSHLYGTNNENSDMDYKAVHLPDARDILLGRMRGTISTSTGTDETKNTAEDTDFESFSLQEFLRLAGKMTTIPVEMLFIPAESLLHNSTTWSTVRKNRDKLLCKNANAFVGYCRGQAVKYSARGDRLETFSHVTECLSVMDQKAVLADQDMSELLRNVNVELVPREQPGGGKVMYLTVYGRQAPVTCRVAEVKAIFERPVKEYGKRAQMARESGGADWKALYHAVRIADEGMQLFSEGEITFPSRICPLLHKIRGGYMDMDAVLDIFDQKVVRLEHAAAVSTLPEEPNKAWMDEFVAEVHYNIVQGHRL